MAPACAQAPERVRHAWRALGLRTNPSYHEIRAAYRVLAVATHPDRCQEHDATARFQQVHSAYEVALDNCERTGNFEGRRSYSSIDDFDWRAEVARVRATWLSKFGGSAGDVERACDKNKTNPEPCRKRDKKVAAKKVRKRNKIRTRRPRKPWGLSGRPGMSTGRKAVRYAEKYTAKPSRQENEEVSQREHITRCRRRRLLSDKDKNCCRIMASEGTHRYFISVQERLMRRVLEQMWAELRIREAIKRLEVVWNKLCSQMRGILSATPQHRRRVRKSLLVTVV
ncbi:putative chaperone protein DNAj [Trypanosoma vivax]|nr:putative chaperone protein DNAj [Trypanosoma vivax]